MNGFERIAALALLVGVLWLIGQAVAAPLHYTAERIAEASELANGEAR